jgi:hypothetical protein
VLVFSGNVRSTRRTTAPVAVADKPRESLEEHVPRPFCNDDSEHSYFVCCCLKKKEKKGMRTTKRRFAFLRGHAAEKLSD